MLTTKDKQEALYLAAKFTEQEGEKYVVRDDYGTYIVCPLLERSKYPTHDAGYAACGVLVEESL